MSRLFTLLNKLGCHIGHVKSNYIDYRIPVCSIKSLHLIEIDQTVNSLKRSVMFMREVGRTNSSLLIHSTNLYKCSTTIKLLYVNLANLGNCSIVENKWIYGQISNINIQSTKLIEQLYFMRVSLDESISEFQKTDIIDLISRVVFFSCARRVSGVSWNIHFSKIIKYWRFINSYKFFKTFKEIPDVFLLANPASLRAPIQEMNLCVSPIVGIVDSNQSIDGISYPIFSNDDSVILNFFILKVLVLAYQTGKQEFYKSRWFNE